jgi:hypothetical protein
MNDRFFEAMRPFEQYFAIGLVALVVIAALYFIWRSSGVLHGPTLILEDFYVSTTPNRGLFVIVAGRPQGILALILSILGLGTKVRLEVSKESVQRELTKSHLHIIDSVPLPNVASTTYGYSKQVVYLVLAIVTMILGVLGIVGIVLARGEQGGMIAAAMITVLFFFASAVLLLMYHLSTRLEIAIETNGGRYIGVRFRPSIIGSLTVDLKEAAQAVEIINSLIR